MKIFSVTFLLPLKLSFIFCIVASVFSRSIGIGIGLVCCNIERYFFKQLVNIVGIFNGNEFIVISLKAVS